MTLQVFSISQLGHRTIDRTAISLLCVFIKAYSSENTERPCQCVRSRWPTSLKWTKGSRNPDVSNWMLEAMPCV
ncbi:hypothetical protein EMCRGX_G006234 [Ephydatia muelleri]